ncbi:cytosine permease [Anaerotruncus colihominis]|uniref:Cytosine permease n=2 Tax=Anaerotruncus colihominis TaxID=169435 RepID=A0A845SS21_9FIRM|nr:cytosine permease [Anaerotruncus colihominis]NDO37648.1 cytosine permease [Anaerotruncus colihominis]
MSEQTKQKLQAEDSEYSLSAVPSAKKTQGLWAAMVVLVGFTFFTPSMTAGGNLGIGMNLTGFLLSMIIGNAFLGVYCGTLGYIGQRTGLTLDLLAHRSFGDKGSFLPSALISFTQIGWFGVGVAMFAIPVSGLTGGKVPVWLLIVITGVVMTVTAYIGIKALAVLGSIAVPLIAILGVYSVTWGVNQVGGFTKVFAEHPENPLTLAAGIAIVVGSFISGGTATPNFTRFSRTAKIATCATVIAFFVGNSVMMIFGAVGGAVTGVADIFDILILQGLAIPAAVTLGLNIWTTNNNALYTAGLGVSNITRVPMKPMVLVGGAVGTVTAVWLYNNFVGFLNLLSGMIPPVGAVVILHYFLHKEDYYKEDYKGTAVNIGGILAVIGGALVGIFVTWGIKPVNSLVVAAVIFLAWDMATRKK